MSENGNEEDPLERIIVDKDELDRERLANAIDGIIAVDKDSGEPVPQSGYHDLNNKSKFVAHLLARRAALALDFIEEDALGDSSSGFANRMGSSESTIQNYGSLEFVENDNELGGYHIPGYAVGTAIEFLENAHSSDKG